MRCYILIGAVGASFALTSAAQSQDSTEALRVVADQVRAEGYPCDKPSAVEHVAALSKPDLQVWLLSCETKQYRVELIPDMRAKVTPLN